jgi:protein SDA1
VIDTIEGAELLQEEEEAKTNKASSIPIYCDRVLTDDDFKRIRALQRKKELEQEPAHGSDEEFEEIEDDVEDVSDISGESDESDEEWEEDDEVGEGEEWVDDDDEVEEGNEAQEQNKKRKTPLS